MSERTIQERFTVHWWSDEDHPGELDEFFKQEGSYIYDTKSLRVVGEDDMQPEDVVFCRDLKWVPKELNTLQALLDTQAAEIERLRALVKDGYFDGMNDGKKFERWCALDDAGDWWLVSRTRAALNPKETK